MIKRAMDIALSGLALVLLSPVFVVLVLAIRLESPGPAFYLQDRVGRFGKPFRIIKFRSMVQDADRIGGYATARDDPRVTRLGRFIRRTSLDELPQLINVLLGDMSLVGPRPDVPAQRANYNADDWRERHLVKPGITGLAQATVRSSPQPGERLQLDLRYVREQSLWLDLKILFMTVRQVLTRGSY